VPINRQPPGLPKPMSLDEPTKTPDPRTSGRFPAGKIWPLIVLLAAGALVFGMGWHRELSVEGLVRRRALLDGFITTHYFGALATFMGIYVAAIALSVPGGALLTIAGGLLFGWLVGGIAAAVAATVGATLVFLIVRNALSGYVERRFGPRMAKLAQGFQADAFNYLLFLRLVPAFPFFLVNLAPALFGVRTGTFVVTTFIGILPGTFAYAFFGAGLDSAFGAQENAYKACLAAGTQPCELALDVRAALTPKLLLAFAALGVLALLPVVLRRWRSTGDASA
jgi:uncharacterized membrane protein YdjX (TVP38/TMEM64 family)